MSFRNLSPHAMFVAFANEHQPTFHFEPGPDADFASWKRAAYPEVMATLGDFPERVPLNAELLATWEQDGLSRQKWLIDVQKHLSATCLVNVPADADGGTRLPAILCWHGHGESGKDAVMGAGPSDGTYGYQMAQQGFVTVAIDWIGAGERNDDRKPNWRSVARNRDWCNLYYLNATMLGMTSLSINVTHGRAAVDLASELPHVDPDRIGVMGLSGGGTMALWSTLCDDRIRATEIICYSDLWAHFGFRDLNYCGMQVAPGLFKLVDLPELQGLLAPRPLLADVGAEDSCFKVDTAMACYRRVEEIYAAAGATDQLELDLFPGEHGWGGNKSEEFFRKHLG